MDNNLSPTLEGLMKKIAECLTSQYVVSYARPGGASATTITPSARGAAKVLMAP